MDDRMRVVMDLLLLSWPLLLPMRRVTRSRHRASAVRLGTWSYTQSMRRIPLITAPQLHSLEQKTFVLLSETLVTSKLTPVLGSDANSTSD